MSFKFQINSDLTFNNDQYLLNKAEKYRPEMNYTTVNHYTLCQLIKDNTKLEGVSTKPIDDRLEDLKLKKDDTVIIDFGDHQVGHFSIDIEHVGSPMDAPLYFRVRFAEVPAELAHQSSEYNGWLARGWIQEEFIHLDELPAHLEMPRRYAFRYVEIKVIDTSPKWQAIFKNPVVVTESSAKENKQPLHFDDTKLQKIYDVGVKTLHDCMTDVFEDGPKRDRRLWLGDLRLQALANYETFDNLDLVKRCLYLFAGMTVNDGRISANVFVKPSNVPDDTFMYDYSLFFISALYDFENHHKDQELLDDLYPIAKKQMDYCLRSIGEQGQFIPDEKYPVFVDWSNEFNKDSCGQAITIYALKQFIALSEMKGEDTAAYEAVLKKTINYALNHLYNADKHLFRTSGDEYNIATQAWMVYANILSPEENKTLMQACVKELFPIKGIATPYMYHHITEALFMAGLKDEAVDLIKNYWGLMVDLGADTYWEAFDPDQPDYSPYDSPIISSYCHAWSCSVIYLMKKYL